MNRLLLSVGLLALTVGCPKIERKTYSYDVEAGSGEVRFVNIVTDDADKGNDDFMEIVNKFVRGTELEEKNPGWRVQRKELYEEAGQLHGVVEFTFDDIAGAGLYKHDKKSPYLWCASRDDDETVVATNGTRLDHVLPGCVAWDRKASKLEVTVKAGEMMGNEKTLVPQFQKWSAGEELALSPNPLGEMFSGEGLGDADALGEQLAGQLMGSLGAAMGLSGSLTLGAPKVSGPMAAEEAERVLGDTPRSQIQMCYQLGRSTDPDLAGEGALHVVVESSGKVAQAYLTGTPRGSAMEECVLEAVQDLAFPAPGAEVEITWPLTLSP